MELWEKGVSSKHAIEAVREQTRLEMRTSSFSLLLALPEPSKCHPIITRVLEHLFHFPLPSWRLLLRSRRLRRTILRLGQRRIRSVMLSVIFIGSNEQGLRALCL